MATLLDADPAWVRTRRARVGGYGLLRDPLMLGNAADTAAAPTAWADWVWPPVVTVTYRAARWRASNVLIGVT